MACWVEQAELCNYAVQTQHTKPALTHRSVSVPDVDPLLEAPLMDLLVNGHDHVVRDPSFLDILQGKEAKASAFWTCCRARRPGISCHSLLSSYARQAL